MVKTEVYLETDTRSLSRSTINSNLRISLNPLTIDEGSIIPRQPASAVPVLLHSFMKDFLSFKKDQCDPRDGLFLLVSLYFISYCFSHKAMPALTLRAS